MSDDEDLSFLDGVNPNVLEPTPEAIAEAADDRDLGLRMLDGYFAKYADDLPRLKVIAVERFFERSLLRKPGPRCRTNPANAKWNHGGVVDLIALDASDGRILGFDHKSFSGSTYAAVSKTFLLDDQITGYFDASFDIIDGICKSEEGRKQLEAAGIHPQEIEGRGFDGFVHNVLMKKAPEAPRTLKDGSLSVATNQSTTPELFEAAFLAQPEADRLKNGKKYNDFHDWLIANRKTYFERSTIARTPDERAAWRAEAWIKADEMRKGHVYKNANPMVCQSCAYRPLCERETPEGLENYVVAENPSEEIKAPRVEAKKSLFTYSRAGTFSQCRKKHDFEYKRALKPRLRARYFRFGDVLHKAIAAWYLSKDGNAARAVFKSAWADEFAKLANVDRTVIDVETGKVVGADVPTGI